MPFAAPSSDQSLTPEEERQALNEMALEDLGGPTGQGGGLQVDPAEAESMRDRALAQYLQRQQEFDRFREQQAQRQTQLAPDPSAEAEASPPQPAARRQAGSGAQAQPTQPSQQARGAAQASVRDKLAEVPGLGPAKISALLREFDSLEELQQADEDDLLQVTGIGQQLAREIVRTLG